MEHTDMAEATGDLASGLASATDQLKNGWEQGREAARNAGQTATRALRGVDRYVSSRPKTVAFGALGTGLALGFLTGVLLGTLGRAR